MRRSHHIEARHQHVIGSRLVHCLKVRFGLRLTQALMSTWWLLLVFISFFSHVHLFYLEHLTLPTKATTTKLPTNGSRSFRPCCSSPRGAPWWRGSLRLPPRRWTSAGAVCLGGWSPLWVLEVDMGIKWKKHVFGWRGLVVCMVMKLLKGFLVLCGGSLGCLVSAFTLSQGEAKDGHQTFNGNPLAIPGCMPKALSKDQGQKHSKTSFEALRKEAILIVSGCEDTSTPLSLGATWTSQGQGGGASNRKQSVFLRKVPRFLPSAIFPK